MGRFSHMEAVGVSFREFFSAYAQGTISKRENRNVRGRNNMPIYIYLSVFLGPFTYNCLKNFILEASAQNFFYERMGASRNQ